MKTVAKVHVIFEFRGIFAENLTIMDKIIGIGNALVDVLAHIGNDSILEDMKLPKGSMQLIDERQYNEVSMKINGLNPRRATGGSAANAMLALANLGRTPGFIGKVGNDDLGRFYADTMINAGVEADFLHTAMPTGVASTFISPDGQRTFATFLGAAVTLIPEDLGIEMLQGYRYLYIEGYLVQNHALIDRAIGYAKQLGMKICLDMASYNIVEADHGYFEKLIEESVDIVFANEEESTAFTGLEPQKSLEKIASMCDTAIVKLGAKGCIARSKTAQGEYAACPAGEVEKVVDTTAAGDFFTAGFMYAFTKGCALDVCLKTGTLLSSEVIQITGTALSEGKWNEIREKAEILCQA